MHLIKITLVLNDVVIIIIIIMAVGRKEANREERKKEIPTNKQKKSRDSMST